MQLLRTIIGQGRSIAVHLNAIINREKCNHSYLLTDNQTNKMA